MKKFVLIISILFAFTMAANAQRQNVIYGSLGALANFSAQDYGIGAAVGFRNYNRDAFVSFSPSVEGFVELFPKDGVFGAFIVPEIGVAIGPSGFKVYPHTGLLLGYDTQTKAFAWGGKSGLAFDFGKHFTLDFSTYIPRYDFTATTWATSLVWRFGK